MKKPKVVSLAEENSLIRVGHGSLMDRVVSILEQARTNVARSVNSNMVIAYWLVGREIVVALQGGEERAEYGERLLGEPFHAAHETIWSRILRHQSALFSALLSSV